jgi:hypothetical protein
MNVEYVIAKNQNRNVLSTITIPRSLKLTNTFKLLILKMYRLLKIKRDKFKELKINKK